jgi:hypothetical protein
MRTYERTNCELLVCAGHAERARERENPQAEMLGVSVLASGRWLLICTLICRLTLTGSGVSHQTEFPYTPWRHRTAWQQGSSNKRPLAGFTGAVSHNAMVSAVHAPTDSSAASCGQGLTQIATRWPPRSMSEVGRSPQFPVPYWWTRHAARMCLMRHTEQGFGRVFCTNRN